MPEGKPGRTFRKVTPDFYKFEKEGDALEGTLLYRDVIDLQDGPVDRFTIVNDDGELIAFLGNKIMSGALRNIPDDTYIRVVFVGKTQTLGGRPVNKFDVFVAD